MKVLFNLLKIDLINNLSLNTVFSKKKKTEKQKGSKLLGMAFVYLLLAFIIVFYTVIFSTMIGQSGKYEAIITLGCGLGGMLCLIMTLGQSYGILFQSKDYEMLAALPIKKSIISSSKLISLLIINYGYFNLSFIPSVIMYILFAGFQSQYVLFAFVGALMGPLLAVCVCSGCAFVLGRLLSGFKYKNLITSIASIAFIIIVFIFSFSISSLETSMPEEEFLIYMAEKIENAFSKTYPVSIFLSKTFSGEWINLIWFVLISLIPFILFVILIGKNYVRINENLKKSYKVKGFKLEKQKNNNNFIALLKKEAKVFFTTNTYLMNVIISPILSTIMLVAVYYSFSSTGALDELEDMKQIFPLILVILQLFAMGMTTSSASSISMEGKQFWILKCSPISSKTVLFVKSFFNVLLCTPFILTNFVLSLVLYKINIIDAFVMQLSVLFAISAHSMLGLWINTVNYKFDWDNPAQIVKSGANTLLAMLTSFAIDILLGIAAFISFMIGLFNPVLVCVATMLLVVIAYFVLFKNGLKRYNNIEV